MEAELWFEEFVELFANVMPDIKRRELPSCMTINNIYETYRETSKDGLRLTQFRQMWKEDFKDVIIPRKKILLFCPVLTTLAPGSS